MLNFSTENKQFNIYKISFLKIASIITLFAQAFYLVRYIFIHMQYSYVPLIIFCILLNVYAIWLLMHEKYSQSSLALLLPISICGGILVGGAGGLKAPGLQWITLIPVMYTALLGRKGILIGIFVFLVIVGVYTFFDLPSFITSYQQYYHEKIINFILFSIFMLIIILSYMVIVEEYEKRLNEKNNQVNNLLRVLLHDISNPAQILKISIPRLKGKVEEKTYERFVHSFSTLESIISDVRKIQASTDEKINFSLTTDFVENLFSDINLLFENSAKNKNIEIQILNNVDKLIKITTDLSILKNQVLNNLISNAIKFSPIGGKVFINANVVDNFLKVEVIDMGDGIDVKNFNEFISPYSKTSTLGTSGEKGTGYGLPLAHTFVVKLGGKLEVFTKENDKEMQQGTKFIIALPVQ